MHIEDEQFADNEDITRHGIIGGYVHGNEPDIIFHIYTIGQIVSTKHKNELEKY